MMNWRVHADAGQRQALHGLVNNLLRMRLPPQRRSKKHVLPSRCHPSKKHLSPFATAQRDGAQEEEAGGGEALVLLL